MSQPARLARRRFRARLAAAALLFPAAAPAQTDLAAAPSPTPTPAPTPSPAAAIRPEAAPLLDEVVVTAREDAPGYAAREADSATKTRTLLLETPQAVSVVTRKLIQDQGAQDVEEALRNVAGVSTGGFFGEWDYFRIRGFNVSYQNTYLDGLAGDDAPAEELWGLERIEVVKGPASTLFGQGPLGGFVNLVSKRPQLDPFAELQFTAGSFNFYQGAFDVNLPANREKTLLVRLNALFRSAGSFVDFADSKRAFVAPSFTWNITPETSLTILTSYRQDWMDLAFALPASGTVTANPNGEIPISRYIGNPAYGNQEDERIIRLGYQFDHRFNESIGLRQNFRYFWLDWTSDDLSYPDSLSENGRVLTLSGYKALGHYNGLRLDTAVDAAFGTGPLDHLVLLGIDFRATRQAYTQRDGGLIELDLFNPNYGDLPAYQYGPSTLASNTTDDLGFYLQDQVKFLEKFTLTAGLRYDLSSTRGTNGSGAAGALSPKVGLTYEFLPGAVAYFNWSRSFNPQWDSVGPDGKPVEPETGENFELGLKTALFDQKLTGMLSFYQLTRDNVATDNLVSPDPFDSVVTGQQRARGIELEFAANPLPGLELTGAYTYIHAEVTQDNTLPVGTPLLNVPAHAVNAWVKYTLQDTFLKGLGVGLGGTYYSAQSGDLANTFDLPGYGVMDAAIYYKRDRFRAQVNFNNVLNARYFAGSFSDLYVLPGAPFNVQGSLTVEF